MSVKKWFELSNDTRRNIFDQVGTTQGLPSTAIEKDWWVTLMLQLVFSTPYAPHLVFKGGTSLSKGWRLIERFSEDIDLAIDRSFLGFSGDLSRSQVKKLRKASLHFLTGDFYQSLAEIITTQEIPEIDIQIPEIVSSDADPIQIECHYESIREGSPYLRPRVIIEIGSRSLIEPAENRSVQSMVDEEYADQEFAVGPVEIPTVLPQRTFLEKVFLLHEEFQKPIEKVRVDRLSRHLYDIDQLMDSEFCNIALADRELYITIVTHRRSFNAVKAVDYDSLYYPDTIDFIPPEEVLDGWKADYERMQESMIYGKSRPFVSLLERLIALRERFRSITW